MACVMLLVGRKEVSVFTCPALHRGHPTWFDPAEWLGSKMAEIYPFHLISPHSKYRVNSQLDNTWVRNVYKI
ncbi:hypothetical protein HpHA215_12310 [Helicobacter pylori]